MPNYTWYGSNRTSQHVNAPKGSGGTGLFLNNKLLDVFRVTVLNKEVDGLLILKCTHKLYDYALAVASCYLSPENSPWGRNADEYFGNVVNFIYSSYNEIDCFILCGDFNARIGALHDYIPNIDNISIRKSIDSHVNNHGKSFIDFLLETNFCILNGRVNAENDCYTCTTSRGSSVVDYVVTAHNTLELFYHFDVITCDSIVYNHNLFCYIGDKSKIPDHAVLICKIKLPHCKARNIPKIGVAKFEHITKKKKIDYRKLPFTFMNNETFFNSVENILDNIDCNNESQELINNIYTKICHILEQEIDSIPLTKKRFKKSGKNFWNETLEHLWNDMRHNEKYYKKCKFMGQNLLLWNKFKNTRHVFDKSFSYYRRQNEKSRITEIEMLNTSNPKEFWQQINQLGPRKINIIPMEVLDDTGNVISDSIYVQAKWKHDFKNLYTVTELQTFDKQFYDLAKYNVHYNYVAINDPLYCSNPILNRNFSHNEVKIIVDKSKSGKAVGIDEIPYELLKNDYMITILLKFFQLCFDSSKIPSQWSKAIIVPIPKSGNKDPRIPLNYRGISLLCNSGKIFSSVLNKRLSEYLESNKILCDEQNGFRSNRSSEDHIFALTSLVKFRLAKNQDTFVCFIDFQKAFDFVDRTLLLFKLLQYKIDGNFFGIIKSMLSGTKSCIRLNGTFSEYFDVQNGVRQGDSISSTLFSIFINDLVTNLKSLQMGIEIAKTFTICCLLYVKGRYSNLRHIIHKGLNKLKRTISV